MGKYLKVIDGEIVSIYENDKGERLINARELHEKLGNKRKFADWIKQRIEHYKFVQNKDFITFHNFVKRDQKDNLGSKTTEYYLTIDMAKELCMVENNEMGRTVRRYFIKIEKRYRSIINNPHNVFDVMRMALNQIEANEKKINSIENETKEIKQEIGLANEEIKDIKRKIDVIIQKDYCLASDIAEELGVYSENDLPHSNFIGAIARNIGMKISYKHYYEDDQVAIVPDISKGNQYYQVYYKPKAVEEIIRWFKENKEEIEYKIIYERNTKNGKKGEVKEQGYKLENVCYRVRI